jgi:hypothetical protein
MFSEGGGLVSNSTFWNNTSFPNQDVTVSVFLFGGYSVFANIFANSTSSQVLEVQGGSSDLGANLSTDSFFTPNGVSLTPASVVEGASRQVAISDLKLSSLALNQTAPVNTGITKTVAIGADSFVGVLTRSKGRCTHKNQARCHDIFKKIHRDLF